MITKGIKVRFSAESDRERLARYADVDEQERAVVQARWDRYWRERFSQVAHQKIASAGLIKNGEDVLVV